MDTCKYSGVDPFYPAHYSPKKQMKNAQDFILLQRVRTQAQKAQKDQKGKQTFQRGQPGNVS